jgi:hypothetical protein
LAHLLLLPLHHLWLLSLQLLHALLLHLLLYRHRGILRHDLRWLRGRDRRNALTVRRASLYWRSLDRPHGLW